MPAFDSLPCCGGGKILRKGDFHYAPPNTVHGPFEYPVGGVVFSVFRFPVAAGA